VIVLRTKINVLIFVGFPESFAYPSYWLTGKQAVLLRHIGLVEEDFKEADVTTVRTVFSRIRNPHTILSWPFEAKSVSKPVAAHENMKFEILFASRKKAAPSFLIHQYP